MRLLTISSCTGAKTVVHPKALVQADFKSRERLAQRERELAAAIRPVAEMYMGGQHLALMSGVRLLRGAFGPEAVEVRILSAGYGLVKETQPIAPYDVTFNAMKKIEIAGWARYLGVPQAVRDAIRG